MKVTALTRFKHGELFRLLEQLGWSQAELARKSGISPVNVGRIINLIRRPSAEEADCIQAAFAEEGLFFDALESWPESFTGFGKRVLVKDTKDIPVEVLLSAEEWRKLARIPAQQDLRLESLRDDLDGVMDTLGPREKKVLQESFYNGQSGSDMSDRFNVSRERIRQIKSKALRKMKHPERKKLLEPYL